MATRRNVLAGLAAAALMPRPTWADAGAPAYLAAARLPDGSFALVGLTTSGDEVFRQPLPDRGHAAAAHPARPGAVAFARRPGNFAVVIDGRNGSVLAELAAAEGRHFFGHGAFSADGRRLFTTENDFDGNRGMIGVRDTRAGYRQTAEFPSGGVGPHEVLRLPDGGLVVANGGIGSHPDAGDVDLGIPEMRPNLAWLDADGAVRHVIELPADLRRASIRHLAVRADGLVAFALQWEGDRGVAVPLAGLARPHAAPRLLSGADQAQMRGYAGSIAFSADGARVALTSPKGSQVQVFDTASGTLCGTLSEPDVCGVAAGPDGFVLTTGQGAVIGFDGTVMRWRSARPGAWDNHLVAIAPVGA